MSTANQKRCYKSKSGLNLKWTLSIIIIFVYKCRQVKKAILL